MDPKHRDRIAFVRVCSGKFERDMTVHHSRSEKKVRLSSSHKLFGNERETVDEAYPGDVIGLVGHDSFGIGDTLTTDPKIRLQGNPALHAGSLQLPAQSEHGEVQAIPPGTGSVVAGRRHPGVVSAQFVGQNAAARGRRPAAIRSGAVPARKRIRRGVAARSRAVDGRPLAAGGHQGGRPRRAFAADRRAARLRHGQKSRRAFPKRVVGANYFSETNKRLPLSALPVQTARE